MNFVSIKILIFLTFFSFGLFFIFKFNFYKKFLKKLLTINALKLSIIVGAFLICCWNILNLGKSDFGDYKYLMLILLTLIFIISFFWYKDFLTIRSLIILMLFFAKQILLYCYMQFSYLNFFIAFHIYLLVSFMLFLNIMPLMLNKILIWIMLKINKFKFLLFLIYFYSAIILTSILFYNFL